MSWFVMWGLWSMLWRRVLASNHLKERWYDVAVVELHIHPGINAVGPARLDGDVKESTGIAPEMIAYSRVHWRGR